MYSESDIDGAVAAGALSADAATALRNHVAAAQRAPAVDEEHFRLLTGFAGRRYVSPTSLAPARGRRVPTAPFR